MGKFKWCDALLLHLNNSVDSAVLSFVKESSDTDIRVEINTKKNRDRYFKSYKKYPYKYIIIFKNYTKMKLLWCQILELYKLFHINKIIQLIT